MMKCTIRVVKTKALISFAVNAKLICIFVFAYADCCFSHAAAHIKLKKKKSHVTGNTHVFDLGLNEVLGSFA